ncbi:FAD-linked oxidase C-terminal domain-containing protein, partial [Acinetobacter baumannii]
MTAEHGVGRLKREWARRELGDDVVRLHDEITRVFDPLGILNPGSGYGAWSDGGRAGVRPSAARAAARSCREPTGTIAVARGSPMVGVATKID